MVQKLFISCYLWCVLTYLLTCLLACLLSHSLTHSLTPWSRVLLEKLTGFQLVKFPAFYGTQRFITAFISARHLSLSWANLIQSPTSHFLKIHLNIILPSTPGFPNWSLSFRFPHQNTLYSSSLHHTCCMPHPSHSSRFDHLNNIGWAVPVIYVTILSLCCIIQRLIIWQGLNYEFGGLWNEARLQIRGNQLISAWGGTK